MSPVCGMGCAPAAGAWPAPGARNRNDSSHSGPFFFSAPYHARHGTLCTPRLSSPSLTLALSAVQKTQAAPLNATALADKLATAADSVHAAASKTASTLKSAKETLLNAAVLKQPGVDSGKGPGHGLFTGKHVILFLSDQETPLLHTPPGWAEANLPGAARLKAKGVEFRRAYSNACMCTSARATLFTGFLSTQHNARYVLETPMPADQYPQVETPADLPNLATAAAAAGYEVVYKGKMHLAKPANSATWNWTAQDAGKFGFKRWNYPDAGANQSLSESGGLPAKNDERFMEGEGPASEGKEGTYQYIREKLAHAVKPVFLVISLVNPHDVLFFPLQFAASGYSPTLLEGPIELPPTWIENLSTKPISQAQWAAFNVLVGAAPQNISQAYQYVNFYANLVKQTDAYLNSTLNLLEELGLTQKTVVIKTADHGEMGLSHNNQVRVGARGEGRLRGPAPGEGPRDAVRRRWRRGKARSCFFFFFSHLSLPPPLRPHPPPPPPPTHTPPPSKNRFKKCSTSTKSPSACRSSSPTRSCFPRR